VVANWAECSRWPHARWAIASGSSIRPELSGGSGRGLGGASYDDVEAALVLADGADVVTYELEHRRDRRRACRRRGDPSARVLVR
jgi:hypothetical protein